jgi:signal transduction histidine kinase
MIEQHGQRIAALVHDPAVLDDPGLFQSVAAAASVTVFNARLKSDIRHQVAEVAASRRRIVEAGNSQRRRLQQQLRRGVEGRLLDIGQVLTRARLEAVPDVEASARVAEAEVELQGALTEIRDFALGVHPPVLAERGLMPALSSLAERSTVPVVLNVPPERFRGDIEMALYFVCAEALTNVAKYAHAARVTIDVVRDERMVTVTITDDGVGGADPRAGSGLVGLADRIEALDGVLAVHSPPDGGTVVMASLPVAASEGDGFVPAPSGRSARHRPV